MSGVGVGNGWSPYSNLARAVDIALDQWANVCPDWDPGEAEAGLVSPVGLAQQQLQCRS